MVSMSLFTGLTGLRTHQRYIDVIGNNLANVSTPGFWSARATFSDLLSQTVNSGQGPSGNLGGKNPIQIGRGTTIASIDLNTSQGTLQDTGRPMDAAIEGAGFFTLTDGTKSFYTRVGSFGVDSNRNLVDLRTGFRVQSSGGGNIEIPTSDTLPPRPSTKITFKGNLPAEVSGPLEEIIQSSKAWLEGEPASKSNTTTTTTYNLSGFADKSLLVSVNGGSQQTMTIKASDFANIATAKPSELAALFGKISGVDSTGNDATGAISVQSEKLGSAATLKLDDAAGATGFLAALGFNASQTTGSQKPASATTELNKLVSRDVAYVDGDQITVKGTNPNGSSVSNTFIYGSGSNGTNVGSLLTFLNTTFDATKATTTIEKDGSLRVTATDKGEATLSLFIGDASGNTGASSFPGFEVTQDGAGPDKATTSIEVVDSLGRTHSVTLSFTRTLADDDVWDLNATMDESEGTISANTIANIRFNNDGSFNVIGGGSDTLAFDWDGIAESQNVTVDLGTSGKLDGLSMLGGKSTAAATDQDGFVAGELINIAFTELGELRGFYTNGESKVLDTLRISVFQNPGGLTRVGDTLFSASPNTDDAVTTIAGTSGAGVLRSGALEGSNVDIAEEFVRLIQAQRGFQANSRVITTTDEILAELVNIVR